MTYSIVAGSVPLEHIVPGGLTARRRGDGVDGHGGAIAAGNTLERATVQSAVGQRRVVSSGYDEAIGITAASLSVFDVSDLGGTIRHVDLHHGILTDLTHLGRGLTGGDDVDAEPGRLLVELPAKVWT